MAYVNTGGEEATDTLVLRESKGSPLNTGEFDSSLEVIADKLNDLNSRVGGGLGSDIAVTLSTGNLLSTGSGRYAVTGEGGLTDDLTSITGITAGDLLTLYNANTDPATAPITVKRGSLLPIQADFIMNSVYDRIELEAISTTVCVERSRASNAIA